MDHKVNRRFIYKEQVYEAETCFNNTALSADDLQMLLAAQYICSCLEVAADEYVGAPRDGENTDLNKKTPKDLSTFCNQTVAQEWGYVWGGRGKIYDEEERDYLYDTYHTTKYDYEYYYVTQWDRWKYVNVADCSGLIEAFSGLNRTAQGFYSSCVEKGPISSMPDVQGYLVFRYSDSSDDMVHVGMYDGNGKCIESRDSETGVVKTNLADRGWTHWGKPDFIEFSDDPTSPLKVGRIIYNTSPLMRGDDVRGIQNALLDRGYDVGRSGADGEYGENTTRAVEEFERENGLPVNGVVDKLLAEALGGTWSGDSSSFTLSRFLKKTSPYLEGADVKNVQSAMINRGYGVGSSGADGVYGNDTYNAVCEFQADSHIKVDGIVGKDTTEALGGIWLG